MSSQDIDLTCQPSSQTPGFPDIACIRLIDLNRRRVSLLRKQGVGLRTPCETRLWRSMVHGSKLSELISLLYQTGNCDIRAFGPYPASVK